MIGLFDFRGAMAVIYKEMRQMIRSPITIALAVGLPIMQMLLLGYAINTTVEHVPAAVLNEDRGTGAQAFLDALVGSQTFDIDVVAHDRNDLRQAVVSGKARISFDIPPNFTADLVAGRDPAVGAFIDGSDSAIAQVAYGSAIALGGLPLRDLSPASPQAYQVRPVVLFNPSMRSANFFVPGLIGLIMQNITLMLTALSIVGELEKGTLDQLLVTPIGTAGLMVGKLVPYAILMSIDYVLMVLTLRFVFGVPVAGNVVLLTALAVGFLLTALGLGLFISTVAKTQIQAQLMAIFILLPSVLLSGAVFERSLMPLPMQIVGYFIPLTYFMEILRGIIIRGAGIGELWGWILPMLGYGIAIFVMASIRFARSTRYS